jgi:uncharacterized membrane protein YbhN (UPF0104 family)
MGNRLALFLRSPWGVAAKAAMSLGLLTLFFLGIDTQRLAVLWGLVAWYHLLVLLVLTLARNLLGAGRAKRVTGVLSPVPFSELLRQQFLASFFNNFLPTAIGGDGARVYYLRRWGIPAAEGTVLMFVERLLGFYALLLFAGLSALFWECPETLVWPILGATAVYTLGLCWLFWQWGWTRLSWPLLRRIHDVLLRFRSKPRLLMAVLAWSLAYQGISIFISFYVATITLGGVSLLPFLTLVPLVWFFTMVPITLGGVGLRELAFIQLLALIAVAREDALFISLGTYLALVMSGAVGGMLHLLGPAPRPQEDGP